MNLIIAVEGIDGAGKNTLIQSICKKLSEKNIEVKTFAYPSYGKTIFADLADEALRGKFPATELAKDPYSMALLFALDRYETVNQIDPKGLTIIDRYVASNIAYTMARAQVGVNWLECLEFDRFQIPKPDLQILVNTTPEKSIERVKHRSEIDETRTIDLYEQNRTLQAKVWEAYNNLAKSNWVSPWIILDNAEDLSSIFKFIKDFEGK